MSNLPGNPHMDDAMNYSCAASEIMAHEDHERGILAQQATTHATLALAYEQRTANLIALWASPGNLPDGSYDKGMEMSGVNYGDLANQIKTHLGLGDNNA